MSQTLQSEEAERVRKGAQQGAALTEVVRHVDIIHTSLAGMTAIVFMLLFALALPIMHKPPVTHPVAFIVMALAAFVGIGGLYVLNYRVHKHVTDQARLTEVLVNSLGQGFLFFRQGGFCCPVYSQACLDMFGLVPSGLHVADVLRLSPEKKEDFNGWIDVLFQPDHALSFEDVACFLPQYDTHDPERRIALAYKPVLDAAGVLSRVVMIATDQTEEYEAKQLAQRQQDFADMVTRVFKDRNQFQTTIAHLREFLDAAKAPDVGVKDSTDLLRQLHTLKASVKQFCLTELARILNDAENELRVPAMAEEEAFRKQLAETAEKISIALKHVTDDVSVLIGTEYEWRGNVREIGEDDLYAFARALRDEGEALGLFPRFVETLLAIPARECFRAFERELRELSAMMEKQIKPIKFLGSNPPVLARSVQDLLFSLTHIARNIVDHGIEAPVTRMARGKDAAGQVCISFDVVNEESGARWLHIQISDDGGGIDPARVRAKLYTMEPEGNWRFEDDHTVIQRIFSWNFTTTEKETALSGRGVGMDAVEQEVKKLGGVISVSSQLYKGATFDIRIPYRLDQIE